MARDRTGTFIEDVYAHIDRSRWRGKKSYVYFVTDGEYIKIGVADDIKSRISGIQTGNARKIRLVEYMVWNSRELAKKAEAMLHDRYADSRLCGEWFDIADDDDFLLFAKYIKHYYESDYETCFDEFWEARWTPLHEYRRSVVGYH